MYSVCTRRYKTVSMPVAGAFRGEGENGAICPEAPDVRAPKSMIEIKSKYLYVGGGGGGYN